MRTPNQAVAFAEQSHVMLFTFGILILLVTLLGSASSAQPAVLKSVQSGTTTLTGGTATATITAVDTTKAFLVFGISEPTQTSGWDYLITGEITNATTLTFTRKGANKTATVYWYVAEFTSGVSVQRGTVSMDGVTTQNVGITSVDTTKSFPIVSYRSTQGSASVCQNQLLKAKITSATNLELALQTAGDNNDSVAAWQVVTYTDASVTSGDVSFASGDSSQTATVSISDLNKAWLIYSYNTADTGSHVGHDLVRGQVANGTTLTFDRSDTGVALNLTWYLVQFTDAATVQYGSKAFAVTDTQLNVTLTSSVDTTKSIAVGGYQMTGGSSPDTTQGEPYVAWFTLALTSSTNLQITRGGTDAAATANVGWFVVQFLGDLTPTLEQEGFGFRADDGSETGATWLANQDTDILRDKNLNTRLRALLNANADPASTQYQLEYKKSTDSVYSKVLTAQPTTTLPTYVAKSIGMASGTGAITPSLPAGRQTNDILLLFVESANQAISISNQNGGTWTEAPDSPQGVGAAPPTDPATRLAVFWSRYNGTQGNPTVADPGDHAAGIIIAIRGCIASGDPFDVTAGGTDGVSDTSGTIPGGTTSEDNTLVVVAITSSADATGSEFSGWSNADLANLTEQVDNLTTQGNGGGIGVATGEKATAGSYGATSVTLAHAVYKAMWTGALRPVPVTQEAILMSASSNIAAGGENTTAQLTPPSGKTTSNFTTGRIQDDENPADAVDIANNYYTELEWCLIATDAAQWGDTYQFRVTANGVPLDTYSVTPQWTIQLPAPVATAATNVQATSFSANWNAVEGATAYYLDVSTDINFGSFVTGYNNLNVGNVLTYSVDTNLTVNTTYYYRVRAYNANGTSGNSNTISLTTVSANFLYRKSITIADSMTPASCGSNLSNFPILVSISNDANLKTVANGGHVQNASGYDIIFRATDPAICTDAGNPSPCTLDHEIETYDGGTGTLVAWVRIPTLRYNANSTIYMYYGNSAITTPTANPTVVWDDNFIGVWHLKEKPSDTAPQFKDSTAHHNDGTQTNMVDTDQQAGQIDGSIHFNGTNALIPTNVGASLKGLSQFTISAWVNADTAGNDIYEECLGTGTNTRVKFLISGGKLTLQGRVGDGGNIVNWAQAATNASTGTWYYAAGVFNTSTNCHMFVNGADATAAAATGAIANTDPQNPPTMGSRTVGAEYWKGYIDELRISNTARSVCWLGTEYNNENSPGTYVTVGAEEATPPTVVDLLSFKATGSGDNVVVSWETAQELDNMGFNLYRSTVKGGPYVRITDTPIGGMTFSVKGRAYSYVDSNVTRGSLYYYKLEDIDTAGQRTMHGPVCVDWDGDGIPDDWELAHGLNPQVNDAGLEYGGTGLSNLEEYELNPDPLSTDTNGDGIPDGEQLSGVQSVAGVPQTLGNGVETISSDETGMTLELRTEAFDTTVVEHDGEAYDRLSIPSYIHGWTQETGKPEMPVKGVILDIPQGKQAALQVVSVDKSTKEGYWIYPVPEKVAVQAGGVAQVQEVFTIDNDAYRQDAFYPGTVAELGETFDYRGQIKQQVLFYPLAFNPARGELEHYSRIRIRVAYENDVSVAQKESLPIVYRGVSMSGGGTTGSGGGTVVGWSPPAGGDAYKIQVSEDGVYRLTKAWLEGRGVNVGAMNLSQLRMYNLGQELPIYVYDLNGNNLFDPEDYVEFYGQKVPSEYSKYTKYNVYWLVTAGEGTPKRMGVEEGSPGAGAIALTHDYTLHDEKDQFYIAGAQGDDDVDRWYFADFAQGSGSGGGPTSFTVTVPGVGGNGKGQLTVAMLGLTELGHQVEVKVNGAVAGTYTWSGFVPYDAVLGNVDLQDGNNTVTLTCLSGTDPSQPDGVAVDYFEVTYPRIFAAQDDSLMFTHDMGYRYQVTGFGVNSVEAFDVTSPTDVKRIADGQLTGTGPFTLDMEPVGGTGERTYLAVTANSVKTPVGVVKDTASSLSSTANGADWILITSRDLGWDGSGALDGWLSNLVALRQAQGLRVKVVSVEDACDEFSYGIVGPEGIKNFLSYAYANWTPPAPRYVLLVGDGTTDPKDNQGLNETVPYIPTYLVYTEHAGETASDEWFVEVNGSDSVPDMDIGRLPAASEADAEVMAGKIVSYEESANTQTWEKNVLLVADNATTDYEKVFEQMDNDVAGSIPQGMNSPFMGYLSRYGSAGALNTAIMNRMNVDGSLVVNYSGHGSVQVWANEDIFNVDDVAALSNGGKLPFFVAMTCLNGYFVFPEALAWPSLAEALMRGAGKGAVGILASTGMTAPEGQHILDVALFEAVFKDDLRTLGPAISEARQEMLANGSGYEEVSETFQLFGDPAMVLKVPLPRMPSGLSVSVSGGMVQLSWSQTQDCNGGAVAGYNLYRGVTPGGPYEKVNTALITGTGYSDSGATSGTWYYVVKSVDSGGLESAASAELSVTVGARGVGASGGGGGGGGCFISTIAN
jgi:Peptidase family C25/Propeptide_C25/Concanavalin A-like lectin/glucanases superfamily/Domain of unknown function (DUF2341)